MGPSFSAEPQVDEAMRSVIGTLPVSRSQSFMATVRFSTNG